MKLYIRYILEAFLIIVALLFSGCSDRKAIEFFRADRVVVEIDCGSRKGHYIARAILGEDIPDVIRSIEGFDELFKVGYRYRVELSKVVSDDGVITYKYIDQITEEPCK